MYCFLLKIKLFFFSTVKDTRGQQTVDMSSGSSQIALITGITGQDGSYLTEFLPYFSPPAIAYYPGTLRRYPIPYSLARYTL